MSSLRRIILSVSSIPASVAFYDEVVGLTPQSTPGGIAFLRTTDGLEVMLHERTPQPTDAGVAPCFTVDRLDERTASTESLGGQVLDAAVVQPWGERMSVVRDPDGHVVCLVEIL